MKQRSSWSDLDGFERIETLGTIIYEVARLIGKIGRALRDDIEYDSALATGDSAEGPSVWAEDRSVDTERTISGDGNEVDSD